MSNARDVEMRSRIAIFLYKLGAIDINIIRDAWDILRRQISESK